VGTLEGIVGQLEERLTELSEAAMAAPAASSLELDGGPAAELVVVSNALRKEWKAATAALSTSRHLLGTLEAEYKEAREWALGCSAVLVFMLRVMGRSEVCLWCVTGICHHVLPTQELQCL
jgi:hypothetical protein